MYRGKRWIPSLTESSLLGGKKEDRQEINLELWKISDTAHGGGKRITEPEPAPKSIVFSIFTRRFGFTGWHRRYENHFESLLKSL